MSLIQVIKMGRRRLIYYLPKPRFNGFPCKSGIFSREGTNLSRASIAPYPTAVSPGSVGDEGRDPLADDANFGHAPHVSTYCTRMYAVMRLLCFTT